MREIADARDKAYVTPTSRGGPKFQKGVAAERPRLEEVKGETDLPAEHVCYKENPFAIR